MRTIKFHMVMLVVWAIPLSPRSIAGAPKDVTDAVPWVGHVKIERIEITANGMVATLREIGGRTRGEPARVINIPYRGTVDGITLEDVVLDKRDNAVKCLLTKGGEQYWVQDLRLCTNSVEVLPKASKPSEATSQ